MHPANKRLFLRVVGLTLIILLIAVAWGSTKWWNGGGSVAKPTDAGSGAGASSSARFEIVTASMMPAVKGRRLKTRCTVCGAIHELSADSAWPDSISIHTRLRCFDCGGVAQLASPLSGPTPQADEAVAAGQVVELIRFAASQGTTPRDLPLKRLDLVGCAPPALAPARAPDQAAAADQAPDQASTPPLAKRLWGLPGERIEIGGGEMFVNGRMYQKSLGELEQVAVLVGELDAELDAGGSTTWQFRRPAAVYPAETSPANWLRRTWLCDDDVWNQHLSYLPIPTDDVLVDIELTQPLEGELQIAFRGQRHTWTATLSDGGLLPMRTRAKLAWCDGRFLFWSDAVHDSAEEWASRFAPPTPTEADVVDEGSRLSVKSDLKVSTSVQRVRIYRDIILRSTRRDPAEREDYGRLRSGEYFLLGDNGVVSIDSRNGLGPVPRERLLGRVVPLNRGWLSSTHKSNVNH